MAAYETLRDIQDALDKAVSRRRSMIEGSLAESRSMTESETDTLQALENEVDKLCKMKSALESQGEIEGRVAEQRQRERVARRNAALTETPDEVERALNSTYDTYLRYGPEALTTEQRGRMSALRVHEKRGTDPLGTTDALGGYTIPTGFQREVEKAMLSYGGVLSAARIVRTSGGNDWHWPTVDDTGNSGSLATEASTPAVLDVAFSEVVFNAYKYTSGMIKVNNELLQDSAFNLQSFLGEIISERIFRGLNAALTTGTGSSQPNGVVTAAAASSLTSTADAPTFNQMLAFYHKLDPAYRNNARWMMADDSLMAIKQMATFDGTIALPEFAFKGGANAGDPGMILDKPYTINQDMANDTTSANKWCLFGNFSKYIVRQAGGIVIRRLVERYADADQTGFIGWARYDGDLVAANAVYEYRIP